MLKPNALLRAQRTISSNAFHAITMHHAQIGASLSVVRMGDGEVLLLEEATKRSSDDVVDLFEPEWHLRMGTHGITYGLLAQRLVLAAKTTDYFAPSVSGLTNPQYDLSRFFDHHLLVDNFFVNQWTAEQRMAIIDACHNVLIIHQSPAIADAVQAKLTHHRAKYIRLSAWQDAERVAEEASNSPCRLVLFSAGPASKFIGPQIATSGKIVLDVGNSMEQWIPR